MSVRLDRRTHADLVAETRARIAAACPELRAVADGDPGLTLTELFAWMTGLAIERLARVPDKLHVALLEMLGIDLRPPAAAQADVRLRLSAPAQRAVGIRAGTEVGTVRSAAEESIVFQVQNEFTIVPVRPAAYAVERAGTIREVGVADGVAYLHGPDRIPFAQPPVVGDALYLGFEESIARLLMQVSIEASMARGAGVRPEDPPLRWEASQGEGAWAEVEVLADRTGGFNFGSGIVELQCPAGSGVQPIAGRRLHWLRCRIAPTTRRRGEPAAYQHAPEIYQITAAPVGALHRRRALGGGGRRAVGNERRRARRDVRSALLARARSSPPARRSRSRRRPATGKPGSRSNRSPTRASRTATSRSIWSTASSGSGPSCTIQPPARRDAAPPRRRAPRIRISRYRHGGGRIGNVAADSLTTLRSAIPGVASVTNPRPARGGVDAQSVARRPRARAALEIRTRDRAVTAQDYEFLATDALAAGGPRRPRAGRRARRDARNPARGSTRPTAGSRSTS